MFSATFRHISPARSFLVFLKKAEEKAEVGPKTCSGLILPSPTGIIRKKEVKTMTEKEEYEMLHRYYKRLLRIMKENGEPLPTAEQVEKSVLLAMEGHKNTVAKNKENDLSNSQH